MSKKRLRFSFRLILGAKGRLTPFASIEKTVAASETAIQIDTPPGGLLTR